MTEKEPSFYRRLNVRLATEIEKKRALRCEEIAECQDMFRIIKQWNALPKVEVNLKSTQKFL